VNLHPKIQYIQTERDCKTEKCGSDYLVLPVASVNCLDPQQPPSCKPDSLYAAFCEQTSPGKTIGKEKNKIVKLTKEQPSPPSLSGTSVPLPSGQSWVVNRDQTFQWTKWRIGVAVAIIAAIVIALFIAFSHPSSRIHHSDLTGYTQGMPSNAGLQAWEEKLIVSESDAWHASYSGASASRPVGLKCWESAGDESGAFPSQQSTAAQQWPPSSEHPIVTEHAQAAVEHAAAASTQLNKPGVSHRAWWCGPSSSGIHTMCLFVK
jgi:hypothetical protein